MLEPPHKLDYADPTNRPTSRWDRLPAWVETLIKIAVLYGVAILFRVFAGRGWH